MPIITYEVINPITDTKRPFLNKSGLLLFYAIGAKYRYFVECARTETNGSREYYILISDKKFDNNCRLCNVDNYGRCKLKLHGELKDYVTNEIHTRGNVDVEYQESTSEYDIYKIE